MLPDIFDSGTYWAFASIPSWMCCCLYQDRCLGAVSLGTGRPSWLVRQLAGAAYWSVSTWLLEVASCYETGWARRCWLPNTKLLLVVSFELADKAAKTVRVARTSSIFDHFERTSHFTSTARQLVVVGPARVVLPYQAAVSAIRD